MPLEQPRLPEEVLTPAREAALLESQHRQLALLSGVQMQPYSNNDVRRLQNSIIHRSFEGWKLHVIGSVSAQQLPNRIRTLSSNLEASLPRPVALDLGRHLQTLLRESERGDRMNPLDLSVYAQRAQDYLQYLQRSGASLASNPASMATLQEAASIVTTYQMILANRPQEFTQRFSFNTMAQPGAEHLHPRLFPQVGRSPELSGQVQTAARLGGLIIAVPAFLFTAYGYAVSSPESNASITGPALWALAVMGLGFGHQFLGSRTHSWLGQVGFLGDQQYETMARTYQFTNRQTAPLWANLGTALRDRSFDPAVGRLINANRHLTPEEQQQVIAALAPNSPLAPALQAMMNSRPNSATQQPGGDFRAFVALMRSPRSDEARRFLEAFMQNGAGPGAYAQFQQVAGKVAGQQRP